MSVDIRADVLIIGSGIAGTTAALELGKAGVEVALITRAKRPEESNTYYAQGGIIFRGVADSPELLMEDILNAGARTNYKKAVELLANEGPDLVQRILIDELGIPFDRQKSGALSRIKEGAHSDDRIIHIADQTGRAIESALLNAVSDLPSVQIFPGHTAIDLIHV